MSNPPPPSRSRFTGIALTALAHPATHVLIGLGILLLDLFTPRYVLFPFLFVIPVALSAWFQSQSLAYMLSVFLPIGRFCISIFSKGGTPLPYAEFNALIRIAVLLLLAYFVSRASRQAKELERRVKMLESILPVCMGCQRIRDEHENWQRLDVYVTAHTDSVVSHGLCPECAKRLYGLDVDRHTPLAGTGK